MKMQTQLFPSPKQMAALKTPEEPQVSLGGSLKMACYWPSVSLKTNPPPVFF